MSHIHFRVNVHSRVVWMSRNSLLETGMISEVLGDRNRTRTHNHLVQKWTLNHLAKLTTHFKHDFIVDTPNLGNNFPDLFCNVSALYEKYMREVHFLSKFTRKRGAVLLKNEILYRFVYGIILLRTLIH